MNAPLLESIRRHVEKRSGSFRVEPREVGFEILKVEEGGDVARPRIFCFPESDRVIAFFYKPSRLAFSRDRFAYGAMFFYGAELAGDDGDLEAGLAFLEAGFHPDQRPPKLKRSLPFTVPEA